MTEQTWVEQPSNDLADLREAIAAEGAKRSAEAEEVSPNGVPVLDFSRMSYGDQQRLISINSTQARVMTLQQRINKRQAEAQKTGVDAEISDTDFEQLEKLLDKVDSFHEDNKKAFARVVVYLPREWFVANAPDPLDFANPDTYDWLRVDMATALRAFVTAGQNPAEKKG